MSRRTIAIDPLIDGEAEPNDRQFVTALARGLQLLRAFEPGDGPLNNSELVRRTGLPKPTVSRLAYTLTRLGYLVYSRQQGTYELGPAVLGLGYASLANMDVRQIARPHMQALANYARASVTLGARDRLSMIYLEFRRGPGALGLGLDIGDRIPIAVTAIGRAYLAAIPEAERERLMDRLKPEYKDNWPQVRAGIERAVRDLSERGFCLSIGEWQREINAVGVPVRTHHPPSVLGFNIGGLASTLPQHRLEEDLGPRLVEMARTVGEGLVAPRRRG